MPASTLVSVVRPLTVTQAMVGFAVLIASVAAVSCGLLSFLDDREQQAFLFAAGGGYLVLWSAVRLCGPPPA